MKKYIRSLQTFFPSLQDMRFNWKSWKIMNFKTPVEEDFRAMQVFKPNSDQVFIDIGANRGHTILSMLLHKEFNNEIVAFEPNPLIFSKIKTNPFIKKNKRISLHNVGLGNSNGILTLYVPFYRKWMFDGLSSFNYEDAESWLTTRLWKFKKENLFIKKVDCRVDKLDQYNLNPYFIKIDVQGFEYNVLKGAEKTIEKHKPILLLESISNEIIDYIKKFNYNIYSYSSNGFQEGKGSLNTFCMTEEKFRSLSKEGIS